MLRSLTARTVAALGLLAVFVGGIFSLLLVNVHDRNQAAKESRAASARVAAAVGEEKLLLDIETGVRGYLITAERSFLEPYESGRRALPGQQSRLVNARSDSDDGADAARIARAASTYMTEYAQPVVANAPPRSRRARSRVAADGKRRMDALRGMLDGYVAAELAELRRHRVQSNKNATRTMALAAAGLISSVLLVLLVAVYQLRSVLAPMRRAGTAARRVATGDLSARLDEGGAGEVAGLAKSFNLMATSLEYTRDALEHQNAELEAQQVEADRLKDEFFALVSHELRTPLTSIIGYVELVLEQEDGVDDEPRRFLEVVRRNARRLLRLVSDLLFVAEVEAGGVTLDPGPVDMMAVCSESVDTARPRAEAGGVTLVLDAERVPTITGDAGRLGQAIDNLVSNALKFTPADGVVSVGLRRAGDEIVVEVSDSGVGIPDSDEARLFDRFFRSQSAHEQAVPGVGLGLTIVKAIVDGHHGEIGVQSREGHGTRFVVTLPVAVADERRALNVPLAAADIRR